PIRPPPLSPCFPYTTLFRSARPQLDECRSDGLLIARVYEFEALERGDIELAELLHRRPARTLASAPKTAHVRPRVFIKIICVNSDRKSTRLNSSHQIISYAV